MPDYTRTQKKDYGKYDFDEEKMRKIIKPSTPLKPE